MTKIQLNRNILILHLTILIWGFTGILGSLISVSALHLVWYRVSIASIALLIYFLVTKQSIVVSRKQFLQFFMVGAVVGLHWVLFFYSIKVSTVSVTLVTLSSVTLFTAILEPIVNKKRIALLDIVVGLVIIIGIYTIFSFETRYLVGLL
ncbi:MAG TPA: EamA family transporter, partial [Sphingobacterium sp.]|nr:EamA family transporter [Sphingobacterium sp.]